MISPEVSVVIPIFNGEEFIEKCLDSVVRQTMSDVEILCIDDGSFDLTPEILAKYAALDPRIRVITQTNMGLSSARNTGIREARGKYIYFLDSDDSIRANALATLAEFAHSHELDVVYFNTTPFYEDEAIVKVFQSYFAYCKRSGEYPGIRTGRELFVEMVSNDDWKPMVWIQFYRREFLNKFNIWFLEGLRFEDNAFSFEVAMNAQRVAWIPESLHHYLIRTQSIMSSDHDEKHLLEALAIYQHMAKIAGEHRFAGLSEISAVAKVLDSPVNHLRSIAKGLNDESRLHARSRIDDPRILHLVNQAMWLADLELRLIAQKRAHHLELKEQLHQLEKTVSFRVGKTITMPARKLKFWVKSLHHKFSASNKPES